MVDFAHDGDLVVVDAFGPIPPEHDPQPPR